MESRIRSILLGSAALMILFSSSLVQAAAPEEWSEEEIQLKSVIEPTVERREFDEARIDTEDFEVTAFMGILSIEDFGSNFVLGGRFAYHITEKLFIEGAIGKSQGGTTSYEEIAGGAPILTESERQLSYYNAAVGFSVLPGEAFVTSGLTYNSDLFVIAGIGSTTFAGAGRYTLNYGLGYRLFMRDFMAVRADFRDHVFNMDLISADKITHNLEFSLGLSFFF